MDETKSHWTNNSTIREVHSMACSRNAAGQRYSHHSSYKYIILLLFISYLIRIHWFTNELFTRFVLHYQFFLVYTQLIYVYKNVKVRNTYYILWLNEIKPHRIWLNDWSVLHLIILFKVSITLCIILDLTLPVFSRAISYAWFYPLDVYYCSVTILYWAYDIIFVKKNIYLYQ